MDDKPHSDSYTSQTGKKSLVLVSGAKQENTSHSHKTTTKEKIKTKWKELDLQDRAMVLLTSGILLVAGVTAIILSAQLSNMAEQTKQIYHQSEIENRDASFRAAATSKELLYAGEQASTAQRSLELQNRPWVSLQNFRQTEGERVPDPKDLADWRVTYDVVNTGYSPAVKVVVRGFVTINKGINGTFERDAPCREADRDANNRYVENITVFKQEPIIQDDVLNFPEGQQPAVNGFNSMVMCISYRDGTTNKLHHTRMLFRAIIHFPDTPSAGSRIPYVVKFVLQDASTD